MDDHPLMPLPDRWVERITSRATPRGPAVRSFGTVDARYGRAALRGELDRLRACQPGGRHDHLNTSAFRLAQLVASGKLAAATVRRALIDAGVGHGFREREVERIVASAIKAGLSAPRGR